MVTVERYDIGELRKPERTPEGFLKVDARLTRTGVFTYRTRDGGVRRELRLPEEVFKADSMETFHLATLTLGHPPVPVLPGNFKEFAVGTVGKVVRDGSHQRAPLVINDEAAIRAVEDGVREISNGYYCDLEERSGTFNGERFDAIQRNIRGNHVAIVAEGRAGPSASIRMDENGAVMTTDDEVVFDDDVNKTSDSAPRGDTKEKDMVKITIDGVDYEGSEQLAQAVAKLKKDAEKQARVDAKTIEGLEAKIEDASTADSEALNKEKARADAAEEKVNDLTAKLDEANDPEKVRTRIAERLDLERTASKFVEDDFTKLTDREIQERVILAVSPSAKLDGADDGYVKARFDQAIESEPTKKSGLDKARERTIPVDNNKRDDGELVRDSIRAQKEMEERSHNAWKQPLTASLDGDARKIHLSDAGVR